jgi:hypothetical protein
MRILKNKFITVRSNKRWPKYLQVRASRVREQRRFLLKRKNLQDERLCFLKNDLILNKNVVACLGIRYHKLFVLFQSLTLSIGHRNSQDFASQTYPQKTIDACYSSVCPQ